MEDRFFGTLGVDEEFERKASYVARLGSGSACRSVFAYAAVWGATPSLAGSSDEYAVPLMNGNLHEIFKNYLNDILIISSNPKKVSSTAGHNLMENHSFAAARFEQAKVNMNVMLQALKSGDIETFGRVTEEEAMTLHALMMSSRPSYLLIEPNTITAIEKVKAFRADTGLPLYFTLDAGPESASIVPYGTCGGDSWFYHGGVVTIV